MDGCARTGTRCWPCSPALGPKEIDRRFAAADRHLRDSGVFYRVYEDPAGADRPWPLSHVPLLIEASEWETLKAGLVQRAELLEAVLADVYGPARLVREGRLPAAVVAGNPEFLRPLVGVAPPGGAHLRFYAVDVGRSPDGHWWVLNDRTQAPSGAGYALENRLAHLARDARRLSLAQGRAAGAVLPGVPGRSLGAQPPRGFARLRAHAGAAERDLFRARLSRALSRLPAGRRRGSHGARRRRLHPHGVGIEARRRAGAQARRRLRRSARAQCPLAPRRARPGAGGAQRHRRDRQFARLGRGRGARAVELSAGAGAGRARARSRAAECRDLVARPGARARGGRRPARRHGDRIRHSSANCRGTPNDARFSARASRPRSARKSSRRSPTAASISSPRRR